MVIIAERINATRKRIANALAKRNAAQIKKEVRSQAQAGASYIDLNAGSVPEKEVANLCWLVEITQESTELPICVDSANPEALSAALKLIKNPDVIVNSINGEKERIEKVLPLAAEHNTKLIGLTMDESGLPSTVEARLAITGKMVEAAARVGVGVERLFIDPCIHPLSTSPDQPLAAQEAVRKIKADYPGIKTTCGLSNASFGLPYRSIINRVYVTMMLEAGLDSAVLDPTEPDMRATILAAEALLGKDEYCMNYIMAERGGHLRPESK